MFTVRFRTDSVPFDGDDLVPEVLRILDKIRGQLATTEPQKPGATVYAVLDSNGTDVGTWTLEVHPE